MFSDYTRPSIRLSALMNQPVVYVMTHDSIGLGEDGPTHQPVEHIASLRAMPNLLVFRPGDARETLESWRCALTQNSRPSLLCLSRQALAPVEGNGDVSKGAFIIKGSGSKRDVTLLATGSEVGLALEAANELGKSGVSATVVSMPCWELFREQNAAYRNMILGSAPRVGIEAAAIQGWHEWIGPDGIFIGMNSFGASAPADKLYEHFGITVNTILSRVLTIIHKGV